VSRACSRPPTALLVPLVPATLSSRRTFDQLRKVVDADGARRAAVLAFFSMVDGQAPAPRGDERLMEEHPGVLEARIPAAADVERMGVHRTAIADFAPRSRARAPTRRCGKRCAGAS